MNFVRTTFYFFLSLLLFITALVLMIAGVMALNDQFTAVVIHSITQIQSPPLYIGGGLILFLLSLVFYALAGRGSVAPATFSFQGEKGPITISLRAIEEYVTKQLEEQQIANTVKTRVGVTKDRKNLIVRVNISAWAEQNLKHLGDVMQREVDSRLREGLGLDNVERVVIAVDKIGKNRFSRSLPPKPPEGPLI